MSETDQNPIKRNLRKLKKQPIKFIGQGAYGCVFRPFIQCKASNKPTSSQYISKIQKNSTDIQKETNFGKIINKMADAKSFFATILDVCPVNIDVISQQEVKKCDILNDDEIQSRLSSSTTDISKSEYISSKIRYAGKSSLTKYLLTQSDNPKKIIRRFLSFNIHMLNGLDMLLKSDSPIIHNDIKDGNVIYDEKHGFPIYIDFGLSYQQKDFSVENAPKLFYTYEMYSPWSFDVTLLSYIARAKIDKKVDISETNITPPDINIIKDLFTKFIAENELFLPILKLIFEDEIKTFRQQMYQFIDGFLNKSWKSLYDELILNYDTWDNYSVAVMYLLMTYDVFLSHNQELQQTVSAQTAPSALGNWIKSYITILKSVMLTVPNSKSSPSVKRPSVKDTTDKILALINSIQKNEVHEFAKLLKKMDGENKPRLHEYYKTDLKRKLKSESIRSRK